MPVVFFVGTLFLLHFFVGWSLAANGLGSEKKEKNESFYFTSVVTMFHSVLAVVLHSDGSHVWSPFSVTIKQRNNKSLSFFV